MIILSCGAGMQSTALALMSCEKKLAQDMQAKKAKTIVGQMSLLEEQEEMYPEVPIYDAIIFCDLGHEAPWVYEQVAFIERACKKAGIFFKVLYTGLYDDYLDFGEARTVSVPFWTINVDGTKAKLWRCCTQEKKIEAIRRYVKQEFLGYKPRQRTRKEDEGAHEMHIGFSAEEERRCAISDHKMFVNKFPLVDMKVTRADNYKYILETWGLKTRASACGICPFHSNYFFQHLKDNHPDTYAAVVKIDDILEEMQPKSPIKSQVFISKSRKRIRELTPEECKMNEKELFRYNGELIWNGF